MSGFRFHAAAPAGEWLNDPNGLIFDGERYRLFAQHSKSAPDFKSIGWAAFASADMLDWTFAGVAIPPRPNVSAYSGCVTGVAPLEAFLTLHDSGGALPMQRQFRAEGDALAITDGAIGPAGRNVRDPYVFRCRATGDWRMLVAEPCDWTEWATTPPSSITVWASADKRDWFYAGRIGPWDPPGIMWEVPLLLDFDGAEMLILSKVDRRGGDAECRVEATIGRFDGFGFVAAGEAQPLDLGPDFYAVCANTVAGWPGRERVIVGWASNWATAKAFAWPGGARGGPVSLPRIVRIADDRPWVEPLAAALPLAGWRGCWRSGAPLALIVEGAGAALRFTIDGRGAVVASRVGPGPSQWAMARPVTLSNTATVTVFVDAGLVEIFFDGRALTAFVAGASEIREGQK